jgi:hypothetical protein
VTRDRRASHDFLPMSAHLSHVLVKANGPRVQVRWLMDQLGERSFGLTLFMMAVVAFVPGASTVVGLLVAWPAIQMMLGHKMAVLPRVVAQRTVGVARLARIIGFVEPRLAWLERLVRPRWPTPFQATKRLTGSVMLLLGLTMVPPLPFGHVLPALAIMLLALAYLEEDGIALVVALLAALASIGTTVAAVWGAVETVDWLDPPRP